MSKVRAKKHLGQHFLKDEAIAQDIAETLPVSDLYTDILEVGPGMGVMTKYLLEREDVKTYVSEIDTESVTYLQEHFPNLGDRIIVGDFLHLDLGAIFPGQFCVTGNYPYNISSQIFFKVLDFKEKIPFVSGMLQKEVAQRIAAPHGSKVYGILSVLIQAYYNVEYLFTVDPHVFDPPPKVMSGVIRLTRKDSLELGCDEKHFKRIVKQGFATRRKTLRNCMKSIGLPEDVTQQDVFSKRAEQLSVQDFIDLTNLISPYL